MNIAIIGLVVVVCGSMLAYGSINYILVHNMGNVRVDYIGVYEDPYCTTRTVNVEWGILKPGDSTGHTVFLRNEGSYNITSQLTIENPLPLSLFENASCTWDKQGTLIAPHEVKIATITLNIYTNATETTFSFDLRISGLEA